MCDFVCIIILSCFKCSCVYLTEVKWNKHFCQNYIKKVFEHRNLKHIWENNQWKKSKDFQVNVILRESEQRYVSHFRTEQSESTSWPKLFRKQEDYKTALLFLIPQSHRNGYFHQCQCRGCFSTMDFYMKTLISFGESSII